MNDNTRHRLAATATIAVVVTTLALATTPALAAVTATTAPASVPADGPSDTALSGANEAEPLRLQESGQLRLSTVTVNPDDTAVVRLRADADDVAGYQANITFDPSVIRVEGAEGTDDFGSPVANVNNEEGWVVLTQSSTEGVDDPVLARLRVTAVGDDGDSTTLSLVGEDTSVNDVERNTLDLALVNGQVDIAAGEMVANQNGTDSETTTQPPSDSQNTDESPGDGGGGPLGNPVMLVGGAVVLGGGVAGGIILGKRL